MIKKLKIKIQLLNFLNKYSSIIKDFKNYKNILNCGTYTTIKVFKKKVPTRVHAKLLRDLDQF